MDTPDIPQDEALRLHTLKSLNVLDTQPEERFDRLTRMAKRIFDVPIALVSLVDENRQWFKSCIGLDTNETSREISFCGHTILDHKTLIIPNAIEDSRFANNPLVVNEPNIRFYAGCPLSVNGHRLGTLCIIDQAPRDFDSHDAEILKDLAVMVERELSAIQLATLDELTGISNRRGFLMLAQHSLNLSLRQKIQITLVFIDLDQFKSINDEFGHTEGDTALIAFADLMKNTFRNSDIIARLSGDEFVLLLSDTSKNQAQETIAVFEQSLHKYNAETNRSYAISFSYGIVEFDNKKHTSIEELLNDSDLLMYALKNQKKTNSLV